MKIVEMINNKIVEHIRTKNKFKKNGVTRFFLSGTDLKAVPLSINESKNM